MTKKHLILYTAASSRTLEGLKPRAVSTPLEGRSRTRLTRSLDSSVHDGAAIVDLMLPGLGKQPLLLAHKLRTASAKDAPPYRLPTNLQWRAQLTP